MITCSESGADRKEETRTDGYNWQLLERFDTPKSSTKTSKPGVDKPKEVGKSSSSKKVSRVFIRQRTVLPDPQVGIHLEGRPDRPDMSLRACRAGQEEPAEGRRGDGSGQNTANEQPGQGQGSGRPLQIQELARLLRREVSGRDHLDQEQGRVGWQDSGEEEEEERRRRRKEEVVSLEERRESV